MRTKVLGVGRVSCFGLGPGWFAGCFDLEGEVVPAISRKDVFEHADQRFGRLDAFSKIGLAALAFACQDGGGQGGKSAATTGVIAATRFGCLTTDQAFSRTVRAQDQVFPSPQLFTYTLPNIFLGEAALRFGFRGPTFVIEDTGDAVAAALKEGLLCLAEKEATHMLVGLCEVGPPDFFPEQEHVTKGALFLLLGEEKGHKGPLVCFSNGEVTVEGIPVHGLADLIGVLDQVFPGAKETS